MTRTEPSLDGPASEALLKLGRFFTKWDETSDGRAVFRKGDALYRDRWSHDKVVRYRTRDRSPAQHSTGGKKAGLEPIGTPTDRERRRT